MGESVASVTYQNERVGYMALDGGQTSGLCYGEATLTGLTNEVFERDPPKTAQVFCWDERFHGSRAHQSGCDEICSLFSECQVEWILSGIPFSRHFFIYEDFVLRGQVGTTDRVGILPLAVNNYIMGFLADQPIQWVAQTPGMAKQRWSNPRLRRAGLWRRGMSKYPHATDAVRHAALWVSSNI